MPNKTIKPYKYIYIHNKNTQVVYTKKYHSILEALESNNIMKNFQCRAGYCGICRSLLIQGTIKYLQPPLACIQKFEILICCSFPTTNIQIKI